VTKILIVLANPYKTERLRLDKEVREIQAALRRSKERERYDLISEWAVRPQDLRQALLDHAPQIVHFSGHGVKEQGLVLEHENEREHFQLVTAEALAELLELFKDKVQCVLLSTCDSEALVEAIHPHVNYVIGMNQPIGDRAAIEFARGFYDALGAGRSFEDAYKLGRNAINLRNIAEFDTPILKIREPLLALTSDEPSLQSKKNNHFVALEQPEGRVPLGSALYVERPPIESDCYEAIVTPGALIRVKAPRQMGKTSLMSRILDYGKQHGYQSVFLSLQEADGNVFADLDQFLNWFCARITDELDLPDQIADFWTGARGSKDRCSNYFRRYLLPKIETSLALGLDEVDQVFEHLEIAKEFFGLLRAWHERGKDEAIWQKFRLILVHSKEVYIPLNINQSPFNVGLAVDLQEFSLSQVQDLAQRHGLELSEAELEKLMAMVGGHPYLVRVALYQLARQRMTLSQLLQIAPTEEGLYGDHLRRHLLNLRENKNLTIAIQSVVMAEQPLQIGKVGTTETFKLRSLGLVKFQGNAVMPLCDLYRLYFRNRLVSL
jgi:hypothetical protein